MRTRVAVVRGLQWTTAWSTAREVVDLGTTYFLDEAADAIVKGPSDVVVVSQAHEYGYATVLQAFFASLSDAGDHAESPTPVVVFMPSQEGGSTLLHPILIHELAHAAVSEHGLTGKALDLLAEDPDISGELGAAVTAMVSAGGTRQEARIQILTRLDSWATELLCDALACAFIGPTYLWSFTTIVVEAASLLPSETHPPAGGRIETMLATCSAHGWGPVLERFPNVLRWLQAHSWSDAVETEEPYPFLVTAARKLMPLVDQVATEYLGDAGFTSEEFDQVSDAVQAQLGAEIPPAQEAPGGSAFDRRAILLAAWMEGLGQGDSRPRDLVEATRLEGLGGLLAQALEMATVVEAWADAE